MDTYVLVANIDGGAWTCVLVANIVGGAWNLCISSKYSRWLLSAWSPDTTILGQKYTLLCILVFLWKKNALPKSRWYFFFKLKNFFF